MSTLERSGLSARLDRKGFVSRPPKKWLVVAAPLALAPALLAMSAVIADRSGGVAIAELTASDDVSVERTVGAELPVHVNERVERWIERLRTEERDAYQRLLARRGLYAEFIKGKLRERGMPEELVYLAVIESGLSPQAVSGAAAVGMWQFTSPTAVQYGLRMDEWVDERRDPERATAAALDYLAYLRQRYDSWYLAAAAYNAGPGRVDRVLNRHADGRKGDEEIFWEVLEYLPRETREYVPRLLAARVLVDEAAASGYIPATDDRYSFDRVFVPSRTSLRTLAGLLEIDPNLLWDLNPQLIRGVTPPGEAYGVRVPAGLSAKVVAVLRPGAILRRAD